MKNVIVKLKLEILLILEIELVQTAVFMEIQLNVPLAADKPQILNLDQRNSIVAVTILQCVLNAVKLSRGNIDKINTTIMVHAVEGALLLIVLLAITINIELKMYRTKKVEFSVGLVLLLLYI